MSPSAVTSKAGPTSRRRRPMRVSRSWSLAVATVAALLLLGVASTASAAPAPTGAGDTVNPVDAARAVATYQAMQENLYLPQYQLYEKSDPNQNFGYLWDFVNPFAATDYMAAIPRIGSRYDNDMEARDRGILDYYDIQETSSDRATPAAGLCVRCAATARLRPAHLLRRQRLGWTRLSTGVRPHPPAFRFGACGEHLPFRRKRMGLQDQCRLPRRRVLGGRRQLSSQHHLQCSERRSRA